MAKRVRVEWVGFASAGIVAGCGGAADADRPFVAVEVAPEVRTPPPETSVGRSPLVRAEPSVQAAAPCSGERSHECKGMNECKGLGGCKEEGDHECKGQNDCKGKGGCKSCN